MADNSDLESLFGPEPSSPQGAPQNDTLDANRGSYPLLPAAPSTQGLCLPVPAAPAPQTGAGLQVSAGLQVGPGAGQDRAQAALPQFTQTDVESMWRITKLVASGAVQVYETADGRASQATALARELVNRLAEPATQQRYAVVSTQRAPKANPPKPGTKISHSRGEKKEGLGIRDHDWYDPFPRRATWAAGEGDDRVVLKYTAQGDLDRSVQFTRTTLLSYIRGCAARGIPLRLWIQHPATMHKERFPTEAPACRAANCPIKRHSIQRGQFQVCLDEHPEETSNGRFDPFYVAGYMHLYCVERMLPLAQLMTVADVQADVRDFPLEERNPMSLNRDGPRLGLQGTFEEWKTSHFSAYVARGQPIPQTRRASDECLYRTLTSRMVAMQPQTRQRAREQRNGIDMTKHQGNLHRLQTAKESQRGNYGKRRLRHNDDDGDDDDDESGNDGESNSRTTRLVSAPAKRRRMETRSQTTTTATAAAADAPNAASAAGAVPTLSALLPGTQWVPPAGAAYEGLPATLWLDEDLARAAEQYGRSYGLSQGQQLLLPQLGTDVFAQYQYPDPGTGQLQPVLTPSAFLFPQSEQLQPQQPQQVQAATAPDTSGPDSFLEFVDPQLLVSSTPTVPSGAADASPSGPASTAARRVTRSMSRAMASASSQGQEEEQEQQQQEELDHHYQQQQQQQQQPEEAMDLTGLDEQHDFFQDLDFSAYL